MKNLFFHCFWFFSFFLFFNLISYTQNIIPNGSFEEREDYICQENPFTAFNTVYDWTDYWTAHLWTDGCPLDTSIWWFHGATATAYEGFNCVGIGGALMKTGTMSSVFISSQLIEPLQKGQEYYIQLQARNSGIWHPNPDSLTLCETDDPKQLEITFGNSNSLSPDSFHINTDNQVKFTSDKIRTDNAIAWERFSDCFFAQKVDTHIAVSLTRGDVNMSPPCFYEEDFGVSYFNYELDIDDLILFPIPIEIDTIFSSCSQQQIEIDLIKLAKIPNRVPIQFIWDDGFVGKNRSLSTVGTYQIKAQLDCASFPIFIELSQENCEPKIYVPTAFSPNADGINDNLIAHVETEFPIQNYSFTIFDRWGNQVFYSTDNLQTWNGTFNNTPLKSGVYTWLIKLDVMLDNGNKQHFQNNGNVTILR